MNCHSLKNVLDLSSEGRLSPRRAAAVAAHLASCAACRALAAAAAPAAAPAVRAPDFLKAKLLAAAKAAPAAPTPAPRAPSGLPLWPKEARGVALAAALLVLVGVLAAVFGAPSQSAGGSVAVAEDL